MLFRSTLTEIVDVVDETLAAIVVDGPTDDEMARGVAQAEAHFVYRLQSVGGFGGKSDQLNAYNVLVGDPGYFSQDLARFRTASRQSIATVAREWLTPDRRVELSVVPRGQTALALAGSDPIDVS